MVIAIITILAAMLLPALSTARGRAREAICINNIRQLGLATQMHAHDFDDFLIISGYWTIGGEWPTLRYSREQGYMTQMNTWVCPSYPPYSFNPEEPRQTYSVIRGAGSSTTSPTEPTSVPEHIRPGIRLAHDEDGNWLRHWGCYVDFPRIDNPNNFFLLGEMTHATIGTQFGNWVLSHSILNLHMRHGEDSKNMLFADGHVETLGRGRLREVDARRIWKHDMSEYEDL